MRTVAVIGPGRVGAAVAMGLAHAGYAIVAVAGRGQSDLDQFAKRFPTAAVTDAAGAGLAADLVLVAVPDDALDQVARAVAKGDGVVEGSRWVHTSGGHGPEALELVRRAGGRVAACHPAQTFPDPDTGYASLPGAAWAVTADPEDLGWARVLVTDLRGSPVTLPASARTLYHAGLTVGSNATASVVTLARDLLLGAGVDDPRQFLGPLVTTTAENAAEHGARALTGPVRRGDAGTVARHLAELREVLPEAVDAYVALSRLMLRHARRAGLDDGVAGEVEAVLDQE
jgi:predicted short-subunit dehydrogenase-like oxidoreductase (DUF2520 family)